MNKTLIKIYLYITFFLFLSQKSELIAFSLTDIKKVSSKALDIKIGYSKNLKPYEQSIKALLIGTTIGTCIKFFILVNEKPNK